MIAEHHGKMPRIGEGTFIAPDAVVIGDIEIGRDCSLWFGVKMRGDVHYITVGERTNIQDGTICHVTLDKWPLRIGSNVTIGHGAIVHGCVIHDETLIGMGAKVLDGAEIGRHSLVAAGSLVREGERVPEGVLVAGVPAMIKRKLTSAEIDNIIASAERYVKYKEDYLRMF